MAAVLAVACVTPACQQGQASLEPAAAVAAGPAPAAMLSDRSTDDLTAAADRALRDGRLYVPAGDNALEYWLEARVRDPGDAAVSSAIIELQPYLLIGCEQAIARHDFAEARRLHALLAASDPDAPALERLAGAIAVAEAGAGREEAARMAAEEAERQRRDTDARTAAQARAVAGQIAAAQATATAQAADLETADVEPEAALLQVPGPSPVRPVATAPASMAAPPDPLPTPRSRPAASESTVAAASAGPEPALPRAVHQPPPRYPSLALNRGLEGAVNVAFVIQPDGSVAETRVVGADPPGVFDRSALAAVGSYRFEASGRRVPSQVPLRFALDQ